MGKGISKHQSRGVSRQRRIILAKEMSGIAIRTTAAHVDILSFKPWYHVFGQQTAIHSTGMGRCDGH